MSEGFEILLKVIGGLGIFLFGMDRMSNGMQKIAGDRMKGIIAALTRNRVMAVLVGVVVTALVQSSSVSTVMTVGFVNAGLMTLKQALGVILGANIGTTITGWILVLKIGKYGLPLAGIAAIIYMFWKNEKVQTRALTFFGLGLIFFGLEIMADGFKPLKEMPGFIELFHKFDATTGFHGVILAALVGALVTAIVQSSSATLGITITLAVQGLINYQTAVALVLGENVGTTITAFLASMGARANARRAALAHTIVNVLGVIWVTSIFTFYIKFLFNFANPETDVTRFIATAHTMFNVSNALIFTPFIGFLCKLLMKLIADDKEDITHQQLTHLDPRMLETPILAIEQTKAEILNSADKIKNAIIDLNDIIMNDLDKGDVKVTNVFKCESDLDKIQDEIATVNNQILTLDNIDSEHIKRTRKNIAVLDQYESVSDYLERITKVYLRIKDNSHSLNEYKKSDLESINGKALEIFQRVTDAYNSGNYTYYPQAIKEVAEATQMIRAAKVAHLDRMENTHLAPIISTGYMDILNHYRRVLDHSLSIIEILNI